MNVKLDSDNFWSRRRISRRAALRGAGLGAAGLAGAALIGCGGDDDDEPASTAATAAPTTAGGAAATATATAAPTEVQPKYGGTYRYVTITVAPHWSHLHQGAEPALINSFRSEGYTDRLWRQNVDQSVYPQLAETIEQVDDLTVLVKMRIANFHNQPASKSNSVVNGRQITSEDVVARVEYMKTDEVDTANTLQKENLTVKAIDDLNMEFKLQTPFAFFYDGGRTAADGAMLRAYEVPREMLDVDILKEQIPIGTGPYMYKSHRQASSEEQVRNPDYWDKGLPYFDNRTITFIPDSAAREAAFRSNQIETIGFENIKQRDAVLGDLGDEIVGYSLPGVSPNQELMANVRLDPWTDERARRALHRCIDKQRIIDVVYFGDGGLVWIFGPGDDKRFPLGFDKVEHLVGFDKAEARKLLDASIYDGRQIDFMLPAEASTWIDGGRLVAEDMEDVGFDVKTFTEVAGVYRRVAGPKDMEDMSKPSDFDLTMTIAFGYNSYKTDPGFFWANTSLEDPEIDAVIEEILVTMDAEKRKELSQRFEMLMAEKASNVVPIMVTNSHGAYYEYIRGLDYTRARSGLHWHPADHWFDKG